MINKYYTKTYDINQIKWDSMIDTLFTKHMFDAFIEKLSKDSESEL